MAPTTRTPGTEMVLDGEAADKLEALVDACRAAGSAGPDATRQATHNVWMAANALAELCGKPQPSQTRLKMFRLEGNGREFYVKEDEPGSYIASMALSPYHGHFRSGPKTAHKDILYAFLSDLGEAHVISQVEANWPEEKIVEVEVE